MREKSLKSQEILTVIAKGVRNAIPDLTGSGSAFYIALGTNQDQIRMCLGVNGSMNVTDSYQDAVLKSFLNEFQECREIGVTAN